MGTHTELVVGLLLTLRIILLGHMSTIIFYFSQWSQLEETVLELLVVDGGDESQWQWD